MLNKHILERNSENLQFISVFALKKQENTKSNQKPAINVHKNTSKVSIKALSIAQHLKHLSSIPKPHQNNTL